MAFYQAMTWHEGETSIRKTLNAPDLDNPTFPSLSPQLSNHLQIAPLIAIGAVDEDGRPWTTLWGGEKGMARPLGGGIVGIRTPVVAQYDPVVEILVGKEIDSQVVQEQGKGRMISGLTIDLETRKRVKMFGRLIAGALGTREDEVTGQAERIAEVQLVIKVEQSLGNCPKYLNQKRIEPAASKPDLVSESPQLPQEAIDLIDNADLFFVSSNQHALDMDTNHRGGPAGFLRVVSNSPPGAVVCWPEYSGNRLYQTLGNLAANPRAGLCVPDFATGAVLYLTGTTRILIGRDAAALLPRSNLCVTVTVTAARLVRSALPFRGVPGERSPYNPVVRYLASEKAPASVQEDRPLQQATLLSQVPLSPTVSRFRFALGNAASYRAGQYVTLDFSAHLDVGYSHMRDDDPRSLNDDFVRTFTVSSPPGDPPNPVVDLRDDEFEITIRKVGVATELLFKHHGKSDRMTFEVGVKGFGGEFEVVQGDEKEVVGFVAAGVGITPLLPALWTLDLDRVKLLWAVRGEDLGLAVDVVKRHPDLAKGTVIFVTNTNDGMTEAVSDLENLGCKVCLRRMGREDLGDIEALSKVYLCTSVPMRKQLTGWLPGKSFIFEDFNF